MKLHHVQVKSRHTLSYDFFQRKKYLLFFFIYIGYYLFANNTILFKRISNTDKIF